MVIALSVLATIETYEVSISARLYDEKTKRVRSLLTKAVGFWHQHQVAGRDLALLQLYLDNKIVVDAHERDVIPVNKGSERISDSQNGRSFTNNTISAKWSDTMK